MGTIKCGFWKLKFLLSPESLKEWLALCKNLNIDFEIPNWEHTKHSIEQVYELYCQFYEILMGSQAPEQIGTKTSAYTMLFASGNIEMPNSSFHLVTFDLHFYNQVNRLTLLPFGLQLSYPKGFAVPCDDKDYFTYEDIKLHEPLGYPLFEQLTNFIKRQTKPFRYVANGIEQKPPIRITPQAQKDLTNSWLIKKHEWTIKI